jgi:DNA mismatch repair protein MutS2
MDEKTLNTLEYPRLLERLATHASFSASAELIRALRPTDNFEEAQQRLARTSEARRLLSINDTLSVGGVTDIRPQVDLARRGGVLAPPELNDVKNTLLSARSLARSFEKLAAAYPNLAQIALNLPPPPGIIDGISRAISERGDILDSASEQLGTIRRELRIAHERLRSRLERMLNDPKNAPLLQEAIITQRNGRYVLPVRAEFKGQMRSIIHDQSASGATVFVEPLAIVELNNRWHEMQLAERDEERRILAELSALIGRAAGQLELITVALAELDFVFSCAKYADDLHASEPILVPYQKPTDTHPGCTMRLYHTRHPLLDSETVVPIDVTLDERTFALVITGPNTGGKTVTLKTVGLMVLMAQSGLHIPTQSGSTLSLFNNVYADIGDEQSIEQSLSTFSGHITNIIRILKQSDVTTLVLLDELGAGTDPLEGALLARAILKHLLERKIPSLVATHYPELKSFAHSTPGVVNASMEFDLKTLRPTFRLIIGLPGRSNALLIAERLGLPTEIIEAARSEINPDDLRSDDMLDEIHRQRDLSRKARGAADRAKFEAEKMRNELAIRLEKIEDERIKILAQVHTEAEAEYADLRSEVEELRRALNRARQPLEALKPIQERVTELEEASKAPVERTHRSDPAIIPLRLGEKVRVRSLKMDGVVTSISAEDLEVQVGVLRVRARPSDIQRRGESEESAPAPVAPPARGTRLTRQGAEKEAASPFYPSPGIELDLRGMRAEDALDSLDRYLESAYLAGLPYVRIIHGKGTGKLRQVVREVLGANELVKRWENGQDAEGGEGVTIAHMAKG